MLRLVLSLTFFLVILASSTNAFLRAWSSGPCFASVRSSLRASDGKDKGGGIFKGIGNFFQELDAFMDDATARRLGNGAAFYGKRKSNFYGTDDKNRKIDRDTPDPTEDYQGPTTTGLFMWMPDEDGEMRPVTRMKQRNIERNPKYWDRVYDRDQSKRGE